MLLGLDSGPPPLSLPLMKQKKSMPVKQTRTWELLNPHTKCRISYTELHDASHPDMKFISVVNIKDNEYRIIIN